jgi:CBS domain-containing protein
MTTVKDILAAKGQAIYAVDPETSVDTALDVMAEKGIGALIVVQEGVISGIFSERDFARKTLTIEGFNLKQPVRNLMTSPVYFIKPEQTIEECMAVMTEMHIRHLPVLNDGSLVGLVSIRDVVKWLIEDKSYVIHELERFVYSPPEED